MDNTVKNDFTKGEMWRCILNMAIPMALAQLVNVLYSIVDRIYIGHIEGVGSIALTGLGLSMPIISFITAFTALCGTGGGPLCSIARGSGDLEKAKRVMGNAFTMLLFLGVVLTVVIQLFMKPLLYAFGASDATYVYAEAYSRIYVCGTIFVMISLGMNYFINAQGFAKTGMLTVAIGAVINIILDPILIFACGMGIRGAAIATVFSQFCSAAWVLTFLCGKKAIFTLSLKTMKPDAGTIGEILRLGLTGFVMSGTNSLIQIVSNSQLQRYGGDLYVGAMTVIHSVREFVFMMVHGLTDGVKPVIGYNYGAGKFGRIKQGIRFTTATSVIYSILAWAIIMLIPRQIISVFNSDPELLAVCAPSIKIYFCGFALMSMMMTGQSTFIGLGKAKYAIFFSIFRKVIIAITLMYLLPMIPALGVSGVFWAEPISDLIGASACYATMCFTIYRKLGDDE